MRVYLAGDCFLRDILAKKNSNELSNLYLLRTFAVKEPWFLPYYKKVKDVILDSGAFTFMQGKNVSINWEAYVRQYAEFIKKVGVEHFIELDIDSIVGYEKVKQLRSTLEGITNKQPIPVWHKTRGKEEYIKMCEEYDYVALGGFAIKNWTKKDFKYISWFINEAHKRKTKIHGLGFTYFNELKKYHFDSVDSSAWTSGNRYGGINYYVGNGIIKTKSKPAGKRIIVEKHIELAEHNFNEWQKFKEFAEINL